MDSRVLILAPHGRDAKVIASVVCGDGFVCVQCPDAASLLAEPFKVTAAPEATVWAVPAFAVGGVLFAPPLLELPLPPPPLLQPQSTRAAMAARARPWMKGRMASYTRLTSRELCALSRMVSGNARGSLKRGFPRMTTVCKQRP